MTDDRLPRGAVALRRMHRLRRIVAWAVLVVMGVAVTSLALAGLPLSTDCLSATAPKPPAAASRGGVGMAPEC